MSADLLLHPVRLRIIQALVGREMTPNELMAALPDVPQASLYRQLNRLVDGGLLEVVGEERVRGGVERTYGVVEAAVALGPDQLDGMTPGAHMRYFATFVGTLLAGFGRYLDAGSPDYAADGVGYQQTPIWLDDDEFADLASQIAGLLRSRFGNEPAPGRRRRLISTVVFPDVAADGSG